MMGLLKFTMKNEEPFVISAKNLGFLALPDYCIRCFWIKCRMEFKFPYQIFPSIFIHLDLYQKKITNSYYDKNRCVPKWLQLLGSGAPMDCPHWSKFYYTDPETNIKIRGVADEILLLQDDSIVILDYKTAKYTKNQDLLMPIYKTQLNCYALIAEKTMGLKVKKLALVYNEPVTDVDNIDNVIFDNGYNMRFKTHVVPISLDKNLVQDLLYIARDIINLKNPPEAENGCKDCERIDELLNLLR